MGQPGLDRYKGMKKHALTKIIDSDGIELSGGEIQKLLMARAIYKNFKILILDEPTAALDPVAEAEIYSKYKDMTKNKTAVFISHRLASTRFCDKVFLLHDGKIEEEGTHDELMKKGGKYYNMYQRQSRFYSERGK